MAENILHDYHEQIPDGVRLIPGSGGIFEVSLNGGMLFSKEELGRFPNENEVEEKLAGVLGVAKGGEAESRRPTDRG